MAIEQPPLIPQVWGSDGTVGTIPQTTSEAGRASWAMGFPAETALPLTEGGIPPSYLDFQGVLNALSAHAVFAQTGSTYAWSNLENYTVGSRILGSNGSVYVAVAESGPQTSAGAVDPTGDVPNYWAIIPNMAEINANIASSVNAAKAAAAADATSKANAAQAAAIADATKYLPKAGGTIDGDLACNWITGKTDAWRIQINGNNTPDTGGAFLELNGSERSSVPGRVWLAADDGTNRCNLILWPDGTATLNANPILTSAGGNLTNKITFSSERIIDSSNEKGLYIVSEYDVTNRLTSYLALFPVDSTHTEKQGTFELGTGDGVEYNGPVLRGFPTGSLTWDGNEVLTSAGGTLADKLTFTSQRAIDSTNTTGLWIVSETELGSNATSSLGLFPIGHTSTARQGTFELTAGNGTRGKKLVGHYTNGLHWDGSPVLTLVASWTSGTSWYRKYSDGWVEQGGMTDPLSNTDTTVTLHLPMANTAYYASVTAWYATTESATAKVYAHSETSMTVGVWDGTSYVKWKVEGFGA